MGTTVRSVASAYTLVTLNNKINELTREKKLNGKSGNTFQKQLMVFQLCRVKSCSSPESVPIPQWCIISFCPSQSCRSYNLKSHFAGRQLRNTGSKKEAETKEYTHNTHIIRTHIKTLPHTCTRKYRYVQIHLCKNTSAYIHTKIHTNIKTYYTNTHNEDPILMRSYRRWNCSNCLKKSKKCLKPTRLLTENYSQ